MAELKGFKNYKTLRDQSANEQEKRRKWTVKQTHTYQFEIFQKLGHFFVQINSILN